MVMFVLLLCYGSSFPFPFRFCSMFWKKGKRKLAEKVLVINAIYSALRKCMSGGAPQPQHCIIIESVV